MIIKLKWYFNSKRRDGKCTWQFSFFTVHNFDIKRRFFSWEVNRNERNEGMKKCNFVLEIILFTNSICVFATVQHVGQYQMLRSFSFINFSIMLIAHFTNTQSTQVLEVENNLKQNVNSKFSKLWCIHTTSSTSF